MNNQPNSKDQYYEIRLKGYLDPRWGIAFEDMTITLEDNGDTLVTGQVIDQAALHGLLKKVRDLGLTLISINQVPPTEPKNTLTLE